MPFHLPVQLATTPSQPNLDNSETTQVVATYANWHKPLDKQHFTESPYYFAVVNRPQNYRLWRSNPYAQYP